ncbi:MAG TPA: DNA polymerase I, partial [Porphyromonadaceae bacterium]|nr:DNA polymerase I [Porphyromonadaceae bacterium]
MHLLISIHESFRVKPCDIERRNRLFKALEFNSMIVPIKKREKKSEEPLLETSSLFSTSLSIEEEKREEESTPATPEKYRILHNPKEIEDFLHLYSASKRCSLWVEDSSSLERGYAMKSLSICLEEGEVGYISFSENAEDTKGELLLFKPILENEEILKIIPNTKVCINLLKHYGMMLRGKKFDPIIAHYLLDPDLPHNIEDISLSLLQHHVLYRKSTSPEKKEETPFTAEEDMEMNSNYSSERADLSFQLYEPLMEELEKSSLAELFYTIEMPLCEVLAEMEWNGVRIDKGNLNNLSSEMSVEMDRLAESICEIAGTNFNINSTKQVGEVLLEKLQLVEKPSKTKTHHYQTNEETLEKLRFKHPIVEKILQYRGIKKLLSTYILALPNLVSPISGHIHTTFNQTITSTGRLSSSNPNLQNIPVREEQRKIIRSAFIPEEGDLFFSADYSQIELRIMAHLSQDPGMLYAFNHGMDVHADTASKIHKVPIEEVTAEMRR